MTEQIFQQQMQAHFKIMAKKKLYFALAVMFTHTTRQLERVTEAGRILLEKSKEAEIEVPMEVLRAIATDKMDVVRAIYCVGASLKEYKKTMGEYPEFTRFLTDTPEGLERMVEAAVNSMHMAEKQLEPRKNGAPSLVESAFGSGFMTMCEKVKIKGEK